MATALPSRPPLTTRGARSTPPATMNSTASCRPRGCGRSLPSIRTEGGSATGGADLALTSANAVRGMGPALKIALSRRARPGNWAPLEGAGRFVLRLFLYETTLGTPLERANPSALFSIRRGACV